MSEKVNYVKIIIDLQRRHQAKMQVVERKRRRREMTTDAFAAARTKKADILLHPTVQIQSAMRKKEALSAVLQRKQASQDSREIRQCHLTRIQACLRCFAAAHRTVKKIDRATNNAKLVRLNDPYPLIIDQDLLSGKKIVSGKKALKRLHLSLGASKSSLDDPDSYSPRSPRSPRLTHSPRNGGEDPHNPNPLALGVTASSVFYSQGIRILDKVPIHASPTPSRTGNALSDKIWSAHRSEVLGDIERTQRNLVAQDRWRHAAKKHHAIKREKLREQVEGESIRQGKLKELYDIKAGKIPCPASPYRGVGAKKTRRDPSGLLLPPLHRQPTPSPTVAVDSLPHLRTTTKKILLPPPHHLGGGGIPEKTSAEVIASSNSEVRLQVRLKPATEAKTPLSDTDAQKKAMRLAAKSLPSSGRRQLRESILGFDTTSPHGKVVYLSDDHKPASQSSVSSSLTRLVIVPLVEGRPGCLEEEDPIPTTQEPILPPATRKKRMVTIVTPRYNKENADAQADSMDTERKVTGLSASEEMLKEKLKSQLRVPITTEGSEMTKGGGSTGYSAIIAHYQGGVSSQPKKNQPLGMLKDQSEQKRREEALAELSTISLEELEKLAQRSGVSPSPTNQDQKLHPQLRHKEVRAQKLLDAQNSNNTSRKKRLVGIPKPSDADRSRFADTVVRKSWKSVPPDWATRSGEIPKRKTCM